MDGTAHCAGAQARPSHAALLDGQGLRDGGDPVVAVQQVVIEAGAGQLAMEGGRCSDQPRSTVVAERAAVGGPDATDPMWS